MGIQRPEWLEQAEGVLETLNEGVIVSDDGARILSVNSRFEGMIGIPRAEIIGKEAYHFYSPEEAEVIAKQKERGMREGHNRFEFVLPKKDGSRLPVIISSRAMNSPDGRQYGVITFTEIFRPKAGRGATSHSEQAVGRAAERDRRGSGPRGSRSGKPRSQEPHLGWHERRSAFSSRPHDRR